MSLSRLEKISAIGTTLIAGLAASATAQTINITNIIPSANSAETRNQTEPNIAVDPANPNTMFVTTFNDPGGSSSAPLFRSTLGGGVGSWSIPQVLSSADWTIN